MSNRIITISRQFGSGGRTIGKAVAVKLGIPCYDTEIITKIAAKSGLSDAFIADRGEYTPAPSLFGSMFAGRDARGCSIEDELWHCQRQVILDLADKGPCVIVGRCADYILRDRDILTVFIHASMKKRTERIVSVYGESNVKPAKRLADKDKRRRAYYQLYTDTNWGDAANYHLTLDSGKLGIDTCVDVIAALYSK